MASLTSTLCKRFTKTEDGNVAIMTAVLAAVVIGGAALAIDGERGLTAKSRLNAASDAVSLYLAKSGVEDEAELTAMAQAHLDLIYGDGTGDRVEVLSVVREGDQVFVQLADNKDTTLASIFGRSDMDIRSGASAIFSQREMDIALVLDTTDSMRGSKITALKQAAGEMVSTIEGYDNAKVRMSVVPFSNYVNVGVSRRNAEWLDAPADNVNRWEGGCNDNHRDVIGRSDPYTAYGTRNVDGKLEEYSYTAYRTVEYGEPYRKCYDGGEYVQGWTGCVGSRSVPYDTRPGFSGRKVPGLLKVCGSEIQALTSDISAVKSTIDGLGTFGNTYMPAGLLWGWRTLHAEAPLRTDLSDGTERIMIVMTDGKNSVRKQGSEHEVTGGSDAGAVDVVNREANNKTRTLCNGVKGDDITVYTIAYEVDDSRTRTLLEQCASSRANFFDARNAQELNRAFQDIGATLNQLRITT